jgi:predicted branched-subunit amino acid permease
MTSPAAPSPRRAAFVEGVRSAWLSVFSLVLLGTYVGVGALAHEFGFSFGWLTLSTVFVWAAPAQVILISTLGAGAALIEVAIAVTLSAVRLLPMVVALLPLLKHEKSRQRDLVLPAHFTAISMWVESLRLLPALPRERRAAFCNGLGAGYMSVAITAGAIGFFLAGRLPLALAAALLFLTPMSFLVSVIRNSRLMMERLAFGLGLFGGPVLAAWQVDLDLMWTGVLGGTVAYAVHRLWRLLQ